MLEARQRDHDRPLPKDAVPQFQDSIIEAIRPSCILPGRQPDRIEDEKKH
jgi:hypothetical protein